MGLLGILGIGGGTTDTITNLEPHYDTEKSIENLEENVGKILTPGGAPVRVEGITENTDTLAVDLTILSDDGDYGEEEDQNITTTKDLNSNVAQITSDSGEITDDVKETVRRFWGLF